MGRARYKGAHGGRGGAKCLGKGTKVVAFDGALVNVESVKIGDTLLGIDGTARTVLSVTSGVEPLYEVRQLTAQNYVANGAHILALEQSGSSLAEGRYPEMASGLISVEDYGTRSERFKAQLFGFKRQAAFAEADQPLDPYFFGLWLGDGDSARPAITTADHEIVSYLSEFASGNGCRLSKFGKPDNKASGYLVSRINGTSQENPVTAKLRSLGVLNNKHIPDCYSVASVDQRLSFLAGFIDTDGCVHNNCYVVSQSREALISRLKFVADSLGFKTNLRHCKAKCGDLLCDAWRLTIGGDVWRIPCKIARKILTEAGTSKNKDWRRTRVDVVPIGEGEFYGFELDGDHLFFLKDFTVTHNSHFFAEQAILRCYADETKVVCIREVQESIKDSVKTLLEAKIQAFGLGDFFEVLGTEIRGRNGSLIIFKGMQSYNAQNIKSLEGFDIAWTEEAQALSDVSLRMLRPTLRKEGSELWFSWNPRHDTDAVDEFLRGPNKPEGSIVVEVNWQDNPWFPDVLRVEKDQDYAADPEMAAHVWGGDYEIVSEGSYYARLIVDAERAGRIGSFPHIKGRPVRTAWDIGVDDYTAIWFFQDDGLSATAIDYYEVSGDGAPEIISTCMPELFMPPHYDEKFKHWNKAEALAALGRQVPFTYGDHFLPHDVAVREWGAGARSRVETLVALGVKGIRKGVAAKPADRIQAVRRILPVVSFNQTPRVEMGIKRLRRFRRKWNDALQSYTTPEHDENSHGADAAGEYAINCGLYPHPVDKPKPKVETRMPTLNELVKQHDENRKYIGKRI